MHLAKNYNWVAGLEIMFLHSFFRLLLGTYTNILAKKLHSACQKIGREDLRSDFKEV